MKKLPILLIGLMFFVALFRCKYEKEVDTGEIKLKYGKLLELYEEDKKVVIKAKIEKNTNEKITVAQNAHNIKDLIVNKGFDKYNHIGYWAVMDMEDGSETKAIEFTLDDDSIKIIKHCDIEASKILSDYVENLYILPSLNK